MILRKQGPFEKDRNFTEKGKNAAPFECQKESLSCNAMPAHPGLSAFGACQSTLCKGVIAFYIFAHTWDKKFFTVWTFKITCFPIQHCGRRYTCHCHNNRKNNRGNSNNRRQVDERSYYNKSTDGNNRDRADDDRHYQVSFVFFVFFD